MTPGLCCAIAWWARRGGYRVLRCHRVRGGRYAVHCVARDFDFWTVMP